mmetsp:Transcript_23086/g.46174  ORF Transcript_23086/g.46174 Transcript_23086/m.46174 type:complete len:233 (-) Transcript_23086:248-946(-)
MRCASKRIAAVARARCGSGDCHERTTNATIAVVVASDDVSLRREVLSRLKAIPGVVAGGYGIANGGFHNDVSVRGTTRGATTAGIELIVLSQVDEIIQAGNNAFSSYSITAAGAAAAQLPQYSVVHPCGETVDLPWAYPPEADCFEQLHPQPFLNLRWPAVDSAQERARVTCPLHDGSGATQPLVLRLMKKGALSLNCFDLAYMAELHGYKAAKQSGGHKEGDGPNAPKMEL